MYDIELEFIGLEGYKKIRDQLHDYLKNMLPFPSFMIEVALNEAINNSLKHGSRKDQAAPVRLKIRVLNNKKLIIRIKDGGPGFCGNEKLKMLEHEPAIFDEECLMKDSGRGVWIMKEASDYLTFNRQGNEVLMVKNIQSV